MSPLHPLSADAIFPAGAAAPVPDNKLSGAFQAALGKKPSGADNSRASVGNDKRGGDTSRSEQISKAPKPAGGAKAFNGHRSGHR